MSIFIEFTSLVSFCSFAWSVLSVALDAQPHTSEVSTVLCAWHYFEGMILPVFSIWNCNRHIVSLLVWDILCFGARCPPDMGFIMVRLKILEPQKSSHGSMVYYHCLFPNCETASETVFPRGPRGLKMACRTPLAPHLWRWKGTKWLTEPSYQHQAAPGSTRQWPDFHHWTRCFRHGLLSARKKHQAPQPRCDSIWEWVMGPWAMVHHWRSNLTRPYHWLDHVGSGRETSLRCSYI